MNISNGLAPYQYNFGNGFSTNNSFTNLPTGTYPVTVRDANLCETEFTYTITAPPIITISLTPVSVSCFGDTDGTITSSVGGGVPAYTYQWVIPLIPTQTTPDLANLPPGIYTVTVTDTNLCTMTASAEVIEPAELYITDIQVIDNICAGDNNGQLTVIAGGGTSPYTYSTDGTAYQTSIEFANLLSGTYTVSVQDSRECVVTQTATISEPPPIIPDAGIDQTVILGESTPINATWSPFGRPVTWAWSPATGLSDATIRNPIATPYNTTTYTVTITDETGCTGTDIITIFVDKNYPVFIPNAFTPNNDGDNDYFIAYSGKAGKQITNIQIFDRWGGVMYVNQNIPLSAESRGWDGTFKGKPLNPGVYVYLIEIEFLDGIKKLYSGDITLIK
jgi:gliding motility-associated-like protein